LPFFTLSMIFNFLMYNFFFWLSLLKQYSLHKRTVECGSFWDLAPPTAQQDFWPPVAGQVKGVHIKFYDLNKIIPRFENSYSLFTADYWPYPLYLYTKSRKVAIQSYTVNKTFHSIKHMRSYWETWSKTMIYPNPWYNEGLM
jgi:hypothetical protein